MRLNRKNIVSFAVLLTVLAFTGAATAQTTLQGLMDKVQQTSLESKTTVEILNSLSQEGELDSTVPKRTINLEAGKVETIFVFDLGQDHEKAFTELQSYLGKAEAFQTTDRQTGEGLEAVELQKGTTQILLVKKANFLIEDRTEGVLLAPAGTAQEEGAKTVEALKKLPWWLWVIIGVVVVAVVMVISKVSRKKK